MARPKKNKTLDVSDCTDTAQADGIKPVVSQLENVISTEPVKVAFEIVHKKETDTPMLTEEVNTVEVAARSIEPEVKIVAPQVPEIPVQEIPKVPDNDVSSILPEIDRTEMGRYFRVINNSEQASRIMQAISHQRDLEMWGVHQYDNNRSRNTYARSFYFKDRQNAVKALDHSNKLLSE